MKRSEFELEVCAATIQSVIAAFEGGADRVEVVSNLCEGGTTPPAGLVAAALENTTVDVFPIIRPRGGDFLFSDLETGIMVKEITRFREVGVHGFVIGCLGRDGRVDREKCSLLIEAAKGFPVTFHRAFDMTPDPFEALETLISMGVARVLTSGQRNKAADGLSTIAKLVEQAGDRIKIMVGSGVDEGNIAHIAQHTRARAFHVSLRVPEASSMKFRREGVKMGRPDLNEFEHHFTSAERVRRCVKEVEGVKGEG